MNYYCVGFKWHDNTEDQLPRFKREGIWENGYENKFTSIVNSVPVNSKLAAKTTYTRKENGKTISVLRVHAIGTVTGNPKDGKTLKVKWDDSIAPYTVDGRGAYRSTISQVRYPENIQLIFGGKGVPPPAPQSNSLQQDTDEEVPIWPLNQILFGPPGTGKTFNTINKAVAIAERTEESNLSEQFETRKKLKERFDSLLIGDWDNPEGQIAFVTFHQSTAYEDFIEGIKPLKGNKEDSVIYDFVPGVFKKISALAEDNWLDAQANKKTELSFEAAFTALREQWEENPAMEFSMKTKGYEFTITGFSKFSIQFKKASGGIGHTLSIATLRDYYYKKREIPTQGIGVYYPGVIEKLKAFTPETIEEKEERNYVLIIDEINRGNISQIFGELITLIEEDKRRGRKECLEVILPYSKERFSVPPNLYIIGTMNTADRSVEALDTALRRRFYFEEMSPKPELLTPARMLWQFWWDIADLLWDDPKTKAIEQPFYELLGFPKELDNGPVKGKLWEPMENAGGPDEGQIQSLTELTDKFNGVNLSSLLIAINQRIEKLLGKDYMIGHAYLINVRSIEDLRNALFNKIIPLLQEYFYSDYGRIGLVIGSNFIEMIDASSVKFMPIKGYDVGDLNENKICRIKSAEAFEKDSDLLDAIKAIYA